MIVDLIRQIICLVLNSSIDEVFPHWHNMADNIIVDGMSRRASFSPYRIDGSFGRSYARDRGLAS